MAAKATYYIVLIILLTVPVPVPSLSAVDITDFLDKHPEYKTYNELLRKTKVAEKINQQSTVTVLLLDDAAIGPISGAPEHMLTTMLETHVLLDYFDELKFKDMEGQSVNATNLFQISGQAQGNQGLTHITTKGDDTIFSSAAKDAPQGSKLVKVVIAKPFSFSAIQINKPIVTPGNVMQQGGPSTPTDSPQTSPSSMMGPTPSAMLGPTPSAMLGYDKAPSPAPSPNSPIMAPTPSDMLGTNNAPTPSAMMAPTPSAMLGNDKAPSPSAMTPSPMPWNGRAPVFAPARSPNTNAAKPPKGDSESEAPGDAPKTTDDEGSDTEAPAKNLSSNGHAGLVTVGGAMLCALMSLVAMH